MKKIIKIDELYSNPWFFFKIQWTFFQNGWTFLILWTFLWKSLNFFQNRWTFKKFVNTFSNFPFFFSNNLCSNWNKGQIALFFDRTHQSDQGAMVITPSLLTLACVFESHVSHIFFLSFVFWPSRREWCWAGSLPHAFECQLV